ncbi:MAG: HAMP domain-containing sensor histidine kinase [Gemmatimonadales bacterium]
MLFSFALLAGAALSLAVVTALIAQSFRPGLALIALLGLILADVVVIFLFGRYLIARLVLKPMADLTEAADALASGDLERRAPQAETREFSEVAERFNRMTERLVDVQSQLVRAEKLASLGHLAAGIAHEVGNPLAAIGNYVEVLRKRGGDPEVIAGIDRIVKGLLDYARPGDQVVGSVDVATTLDSTLDLVTRQGVVKDVSLVTEIERDLPSVRCKAHLLEQVVVNLVLNAAEAATGGAVVVGAGRWRYRAARATERRRGDVAVGWPPERRDVGRRPPLPDLAEGTEGVLVWVADSGPGIPPDDRASVFEPFYTTKDPGRGTGLGLAVVQRVIHEAGGAVWMDDAREGGAAFKFFLPAAGSADRASNPNDPSVPRSNDPSRERGRLG